MSEQINKVLYNCDQTADTTAAQKAQARANIGAQAQLTAGTNITIDANNVISAAGFSGVSAVGPIYGDGTSGDPLVLRTSHGLSLVQSSEDNITRLQVTHPVPAPGSTSAGKVLTCTDALENLAWRDVPTGPSIQKQNYGDTDPSAVSTLLIDADDPENYTLLKADNVNKGYLVQGPYKTLLDSGVNGVGDSATPVYVDSNGEFAACNALTAGSNVQISGTTISATDTTYTAGSYISISNANVIANTMHLDTTGLMISYNTLGNSGVTTHSFGPWRIELTKDAMVTWDSGSSGSESVHLRFAHSDFLDGSIINGRTLVDIYYPWKDGSYNDVYTGHNQWGFDGTYSSGNLNGFPIYLESPTDDDNVSRACPKKMRGFKFTVNCGINSPDWLECTVNPLYINNNTSLTSNAARLLLQVKYFYT